MADRSIWARVKDTGGGSPGPWLRFSGTDVETTTTGFAAGTVLEWDDGTGSVREITTVAGTLWTPAELPNLVVWLDADDSGTLWADTGATTPATTEVRRWDDKSGTGRHATPAFTTGPTNGFDLNGLNALNFGTDNALVTDAIPAGGAAPAAGFVVFGPLAENGRMLLSIKGNSSNQLAIEGQSGSDVLAVRHRTTNRAAAAMTAQAAGFAGALHDGGIADVGGTEGSFNGTHDPDLFAPVTGSPNFINNGVTIGARFTTLTGAKAGPIGEVVIVNFSDVGGVPFAIGDRERLEGYLAHKWGLSGLLPASHPYKSAPPYVEA